MLDFNQALRADWKWLNPFIPAVTDVLWGVAVRVQDALYEADDVSKPSLWTETLISAGICGNWREEGRSEEQQEQGGTLEGLFLWVTALLVLSPLVPLIENQNGKKTQLFTPVSLSCSTSSFGLHPFQFSLKTLSSISSWGCNGNHLLGS